MQETDETVRPDMIRIVEEAFDPWVELAAFAIGRRVGAIASFVGLVRDFDDERRVAALTLEHYPGMAEKQLAAIEEEAGVRWSLEAILIIHRVGRIEPGLPIVLVAVAAAHRGPSFEACRFLIDWLKTKAPIWKFEEGSSGGHWIEAKPGDDEAAAFWS